MRRTGLPLLIALTSLALFSPPSFGASYHVYACYGWNNTSGPFGPANVTPGMKTSVSCSTSDAGRGIQLSYVSPLANGSKAPNGATAGWSATAPADITIAHIFTVNDFGLGVGTGQGWWGEFFWNGGPGAAGRSNQINTNNFSTYGCCQANFNNKTVGWFIACVSANGCPASDDLDVGGVDLTVNEDKGPALVAPSGLWHASGWVRGAWQLMFSGDSPSGVCSLAASINHQPVTLGPGAIVGKNTSTWHQCAGANANVTVQTANPSYGQGAMPLTIAGSDAANQPVSYTKTIYVDNSHPWVTVASPGDVSTTAGYAYVTATAGGSPSGIAEIDCSVDGGPFTRYTEGGAQQPSVQIAVHGFGEHAVRCTAANTAVAQNGSHGWSVSPASAALKIGEPTVSAISFNKVVDALRCHKVTTRVKVPARWVRVHRHHKVVKIHKPAHTRRVKVTRCHARTVRRKVTVWRTVKRHGKAVRVRRTKWRRVALLPHVVSKTARRVAYGRGTTVSGWVALSNGTALAGQRVTIYSAPDNGLGQFSPATTAVTATNGAWTARLPAGPSRLVEAVYGGGPTTEPSTSGQVHLVVPAKVKLTRAVPKRVAWGGTVRIVGRLMGGYLPPGGALVRLRIGFGSSRTTYGVQEHVTGNGRFSTTYTFGLGDPSTLRTYWFQVASLPMGNYPFAPSASRKAFVTVGGHPATRTRTHHRRKHRRHRHHRRR